MDKNNNEQAPSIAKPVVEQNEQKSAPVTITTKEFEYPTNRPTKPSNSLPPGKREYFEFAKKLIYGTLSIIGILGLIALLENCCPKCDKSINFIEDLIKNILYPFLTLMVGYIFGKGFPKK